MSRRLLDQIARLFVEPAVTEQPRAEEPVRWLPPGPDAAPPSPATGSAAPPGAVSRIAAVCAPKDARVVGGAAALALAHATGKPVVLVLEWTGEQPRPAPDRAAAPAARRRAAELRDDEHTAAACGRLVRVALAHGEAAAAVQARRILAAAPEPTVLVLAGARGEAIEALIARQERVVLVLRSGADEDLVALAVRELEALGRPVERVELGPSPGAAALARSGTALVAPFRGPLLAVVEGKQRSASS